MCMFVCGFHEEKERWKDPMGKKCWATLVDSKTSNKIIRARRAPQQELEERDQRAASHLWTQSPGKIESEATRGKLESK